jgi:hypothetical protein
VLESSQRKYDPIGVARKAEALCHAAPKAPIAQTVIPATGTKNIRF